MSIRESSSGARLIDDSYNANPASLKAALEFATSLAGECWLVLGDMGELGPDAPALHREAGALARELGVKRLFACGELSKYAADEFGESAAWFSSAEDMAASIATELHEGLNVLVKASRAMGFEHVASRLTTGEES